MTPVNVGPYNIDDLVGDLSADQLRDLVNYLWLKGWSVRRANIKRWRMDNGLHVDRPLRVKTKREATPESAWDRDERLLRERRNSEHGPYFTGD